LSIAVGAITVGAIAVGITTASCSNTAGSSGATTTAASGLRGTGDPAGTSADLSSIRRLTDMAATLNTKGVACALEYEALTDEATGKKELSLCTIDGELATLVIWNDPSSVTRFVSSAAAAGDVIAYGQQWTVSVADPAIAQKVADALGGKTPLVSAPPRPSADGQGAVTAGTSGQLSSG